jgi:DNA-directed RNA polymerase subunit RPC12/RpoP
MPVVACTCGKKLRARDDLAGKKVKCPGCGRLLTVPPVAREVRLRARSRLGGLSDDPEEDD